jgi:hypothetical protein
MHEKRLTSLITTISLIGDACRARRSCGHAVSAFYALGWGVCGFIAVAAQEYSFGHETVFPCGCSPNSCREMGHVGSAVALLRFCTLGLDWNFVAI